MKIFTYDTTLRDGTQREGISLSCNDKLRIAQKLDDIAIDYIEGGWPGSNPKDVEFFDRMDELDLKHAKIASFGSTCRAGSDPKDDPNIKALLDSNTPVCTVVGKTWTLHVTDVLQTTLEENLRIIQESVRYLVDQGREVIYDAEHFFDGYKADQLYSLKTLKAAVDGGADVVVLCDTNGGSLPHEVSEIIAKIKNEIPDANIGVHTHNDGECAVANTLVGVQSGAMHVQGTINGYGERCGNANLCSIIPNLEIKFGHTCLPKGNLEQLFELSHFVAEIANLAPDDHIAYVGNSAFAHKGGIHVAAMRRNIHSYQHIDPELVGNQMRTVVSELSGRGNLFSKADEFDISIENNEDLSEILEQIKTLESRGFSFESAEASIALMLHRKKDGYEAPFELIDFSATVENREGRGVFAEAMVKIRVNDEVIHTIAEGNGPVNALDSALRKGLIPIYPRLEEFQLADYKVRIIDGSNGTASITRVLIDTQNGHKRWSTVGASPNIIEASWLALVDSMEYGLSNL
ncbi:MAG: citramalate synthase [Chloroflexi bacterium]|jgi:2-isopropylmalate synthase|nr:citramalate synthase [Chloroflexota bacterium]MBT4002099.1 citramalate synthase [Chloroflexota bacterium]MBT4305666.1 citramalate synthase [Chloroflexota bacterium]MBT4533490.1 citramalate synthase [Chloroflexota bacterium]MBT4681867.1 citramalate synthase [Chloroflexota bacterium]